MPQKPQRRNPPPSLARQIALMAILADMGLMSKRVIAPLANLLTDFLHIPGGISTGFSLMFLVLAAGLVEVRMAATKMSLLQSLLMLVMGRVGSMGLLSPIGYLVPGLVIDLARYLLLRKLRRTEEYYVLANLFASPAAALTANLLVFRLGGWALLLYCAVATTTGLLCGLLCCEAARRLPSFLKGRDSQ